MMPLPFRTAPRAAVSLSALTVALALLAAGCAQKRPPDELARAVSMGERPVAMEGNVTFFDGAVSATATISRGIGRGQPMGKGGKPSRADIPDVSGMEDAEAQAYIKAKTAIGSPLPPVTLHLRLHNLGKDTLSVEILDFDSDLGNFAVMPATLSLAADQISEPDPMISQLGVTSDDIPVKVTLRKGGKKESQVIHVRNLAVPAK